MKFYQVDHAIARRLAELWQRDLLGSYNNIGDVLKSQDKLPEALKLYGDGWAIAKWWAEADPRNAEWQHDLFVSYGNIGGVQVTQKDLAGALESFRHGLAIAKPLAKSDPRNALWKRDLSASYNNIGDVLKLQGHLPEALKYYQADLIIADSLAKSDADNAEWQYDLSVYYGNIGDALMARSDPGDKANALDAFRQGRAIMGRLTSLSPDNAVWKRDLARFDREIAELDSTK